MDTYIRKSVSAALASAGVLLMTACAGSLPGLADAGAGAGSAGGADAAADSAVAPQEFDLAKLALSGSRLKVKVFKSADGATVPSGWFHDSKLGVDCKLVDGIDGQLRCLPVGSGEELFADAACTQLVAIVPSRQKVPKYTAFAKFTFKCGLDLRYRVYSLGKVISATSLYLKNPSCAPIDDLNLPAFGCYTFAVLGAEVPPSEFAQFEEMALP